MPAYYNQPHRYNHHYPHHGHGHWQTHAPTVPVTFPHSIDETTAQQEGSFNDLINHVNDIINDRLTTIRQDTIETQTEQNLNVDLQEVFSETTSGPSATIINQVFENLTPSIVESAEGSIENFTPTIAESMDGGIENFTPTIAESVGGNVDSFTPTYPYDFEEETTGNIEIVSTTEQAAETTKESVMSTVRSLFENDHGPNIHHNHHHGDHPEKSHDSTYLILIIVLSVLVVLAAVILYLYLRRKRLMRENECSPISIVGKKFQSHNIFSSVKPQTNLEHTGSTKSQRMETKPQQPGESQGKQSSMKESGEYKTKKMESVDFDECSDHEQKINPR